MTLTTIGCEATPGVNVTVPLAPVKSPPAIAVLSVVVQSTEMVVVGCAALSETVNVAVVVPALPSVTVTSSIVMSEMVNAGTSK